MATKINPPNLKVRFDNLDPESEYYRICPECGTPFMTDHLSRKFCDKKHADNYNNRLKRENKGLERKLTNTVLKENIKIIQSIIIPPPVEATKTIDIQEQLPNAVLPTKEIESHVSTEQNSKNANNLFLADLLGDKQEVLAEWELLVKSGFNFREYDSIEPLRGCTRNKINYGDYSVIWTSADKIFITHQKHLLFTNSN
ncbi:MAG: hypothetical protein POELPBGB_01095 [Bacteroidia bacterium]|nr:hypothetical protein [Bacteroidia bacterium]